MKSKLIGFLGAPCSGKSTLASEVHTKLKIINKNSIFIPEAATDYIAEFGIPNTAMDQMTIFQKQLDREKRYIGAKEYIICDSSSILNYFYFRNLFPKKPIKNNVATINNIQKEILFSLENWNHLFYVPPIYIDDEKDGIRFHNKEAIAKIDNNIKAYLDIENIEYTDLSKYKLSDRIDIVIDTICKN